MENQGVLLSLGRMARRLGVTQSWLRSEAERGRVPSVPAGNRYLFNVTAVEAVLAERAASGEVKEGASCN